MTAVSEDPIRAKVSVSARLVPIFSLILAAAGAMLSSLRVRNVLWAMRDAETAGMSSVAAGIAESNLFVLIALYLAILCGVGAILFFVIRLLVETKTVPPSSWLLVGIGALGLLPAALLWTSESLLLAALAGHTNVVEVAPTINLLLILSMTGAPFSILILLVGSVWPLSSQSTRRWGPLVALLVVELLLIVTVVAFQVRTSWLYQVANS